MSTTTTETAASPRPFSSFKLISFDCYGTLVDWSSGVLAALSHLLPHISSGMNEQEVLELFNSIEADLFERHPTMPYDQLLYKGYDTTAERLGLKCSFDPATTEKDLYTGREKITRNEDWIAFDDSVAALKKLKEYGYKLVVLSNITKTMWDKTMKYSLKGVEFDAVYTAEEIGSYKPSERNFKYLLERVKEDFGAEKEDILHVAHGVRSDHAPCKDMGITSCWISRGDGEDVGEEWKGKVGFSWRFDTVGELLEAVGREREGKE